MPLYEYECPACGRRFERHAPMGSGRRRRCACGRFAPRVPSLPATPVTDTTLSREHRYLAAQVGRRVETHREFEAALREENVCVMNDREMDAVRRRKGTRPMQLYREWRERMTRPIQIATARPRGRKRHAGARA